MKKNQNGHHLAVRHDELSISTFRCFSGRNTGLSNNIFIFKHEISSAEFIEASILQKISIILESEIIRGVLVILLFVRLLNY